MKRLMSVVFGLFVFCFSIAQGDEPSDVADPWDYWDSNTVKLWGANVYQEVDPKDPKKWAPQLVPQDFKDLKLAGANYVNFSVPGPFEPESGDFNADFWENLKERVQSAKAAKLKIVISFRTAPGRNEADITCPYTRCAKRDLLDDPASPNVKKFCEMWKLVAGEYRNDSAVVGFDLLVEPHAPKKWQAGKFYDYNYRKSARWRQVAEQAIMAIRDQNSQTPILVEPDLWAATVYLIQTDDSEAPMGGKLDWEMPCGNRLVCAVHQYNPSEYTEDETEPFDPNFVKLTKAFTAIRDWRAINPKVPVCVNEFGVIQTRPSAELFLRKELNLLQEQKLNHAVWLWEVNYPPVDYHDFDVRSNPAVYTELKANWQANAGGGKEGLNPDKRNSSNPPPSPQNEKTGAVSAAPGSNQLEATLDACDSKLFDPEVKREVPVNDARAEFRDLSNKSEQPQDAIRTLKSQPPMRRPRSAKLATAAVADCATDNQHSRSIGYWPISDKLLFKESTAIRHVIVFPDAVGGDFCSYLYQTSTNRSQKGTEAHIAFSRGEGPDPDPPEFWIYDWSLSNHRRMQVPISKMAKWVFPVQVDGLDRNGVLVVNQTRLIKDTTWVNCVYLGVFENGTLQRFDAVYSNTYVLDDNNEQQPDCCCFGYWGPQIESFQNYKKPINPMGFTGCWMIQDGNSIPLDDTNTAPNNVEPDFGLTISYNPPSTHRDFLVSTKPTDVPNQSAVNSYVTDQMAKLNIPGLSLSIVYNGAVYTNAWGQANLESNVPATTDTVFELASMSKPFLATAAVLLSRDPNPPFALDDTVRNYLPELPAAWSDITVRHLLSHLSGIKEYLQIREFSTRREYSDGNLLNLATSEPLNFTPGDQLDYTNTGYCILAMLMERTTGKTYGAILNEKIFFPLGMNSTRVNDSAEIIPGRAEGYSFRFGKQQHADFVARSQLAFADCGIVSTTNDLLRWDQEMWKDDSTILPKDLLTQLWTPAMLNNGQPKGYGLGWDLYWNDEFKVTAVAHGGSIEGFRSIIYRFLDRNISVVVLFNCELENEKNYDFAWDLANLVDGSKQQDAGLRRGIISDKRRTALPRH